MQRRCHQLLYFASVLHQSPTFLHLDDIIAVGVHEAIDAEDLGGPGALVYTIEGVSVWGRGCDL